MSSIKKRLDALCESLNTAEVVLDQTTKCLIEALTGIHERLENIEKWILDQKANKEK